MADGTVGIVEDGVSVLRAPLRPDVPLQMIAVSDIGEIAGDDLTAEQVADVLGRQAGQPARFDPLPVEVVDDDDLEAMFTWFQELPAYTADLAGTRALLPTVEDFAGFVSKRP